MSPNYSLNDKGLWKTQSAPCVPFLRPRFDPQHSRTFFLFFRFYFLFFGIFIDCGDIDRFFLLALPRVSYKVRLVWETRPKTRSSRAHDTRRVRREGSEGFTTRARRIFADLLRQFDILRIQEVVLDVERWSIEDRSLGRSMIDPSVDR